LGRRVWRVRASKTPGRRYSSRHETIGLRGKGKGGCIWLKSNICGWGVAADLWQVAIDLPYQLHLHLDPYLYLYLFQP
jgi:hypothetical protein